MEIFAKVKRFLAAKSADDGSDHNSAEKNSTYIAIKILDLILLLA
jgi:hypothetical protein